MPRTFDLELERRWRERLREFERSGLSVREFCRAQAVQEYTFFWWRRELTKRDRLRRSARSSPIRPLRDRATRRANQRSQPSDLSSSRAEKRHRTPAFVPVQLVSDPIGPSCVEIRLGAFLLRVPTTIEERALRQVIRVVREEAAGC